MIKHILHFNRVYFTQVKILLYSISLRDGVLLLTAGRVSQSSIHAAQELHLCPPFPGPFGGIAHFPPHVVTIASVHHPPLSGICLPFSLLNPPPSAFPSSPSTAHARPPSMSGLSDPHCYCRRRLRQRSDPWPAGKTAAREPAERRQGRRDAEQAQRQPDGGAFTATEQDRMWHSGGTADGEILERSVILA